MALLQEKTNMTGIFTWKELSEDRALTNNVTVFSARMLPNLGSIPNA